MSFLNPWLLAGLAGIASPIIIHLLARKQTKRVVWAAMRFLKATVDRNRRRMTLEDIVLLVLRCLVLVLLALALARPALRSSTAGVIGAGETAIVLLDHSGSMDTTDGAVTRFEKAQQAAEQILDSLPAGSSVAVWLVSDQVRDLVPEPTRDLALARKVIRDARRSDRATSWHPAIQRALQVLERHASPSGQIYIVTDAQAAGWKNLGETRHLFEAAHDTVRARIILVNEGEQANVGLTQVRLASAMATVGQPLRFEVGLANFGPEEQRDVAVSLAIDDEAPSEEQTIPVLPPTGEPKSLSLFATFSQPGFHTVTARLRRDRCAFDDTRTFALHVAGQIDILLVDGEPGDEPRASEVFYLGNALTPIPPELREQFFIKTRTITPAEFEQTSLREFEAVVLANVVDLPAPAVAALANYVRAGGGLMVFPGGKINLPFYNDRLHAETGLLPAAFGQPRGDLPGDSAAATAPTFFTLQAKDYTHRIVTPWNDPANGTLTTAQFYRIAPLIPAPAGTSTGEAGPPIVALAFADGLPAIVERSFGFGRVLQFASTADASWNDFPVRPLFLPLVHRALGHLLARGEDRLNVPVGSVFSYAVAPELTGREFSVLPPNGKKEDVRPRTLELQGNLPLLRHAETDLSGTYRVDFADHPDASLRFAAFAHPDESNLREIPAADLAHLSQIAPVLRWTPGVDLRAQIHRQRTGTELWLPLLLSALALVLAETLLGNRWSRSR